MLCHFTWTLLQILFPARTHLHHIYRPLQILPPHHTLTQLVTPSAPPHTQEYLGITGDPTFCRLAREMAFGKECAALQEGRITTVQGLSGGWGCAAVWRWLCSLCLLCASPACSKGALLTLECVRVGEVDQLCDMYEACVRLVGACCRCSSSRGTWWAWWLGVLQCIAVRTRATCGPAPRPHAAHASFAHLVWPRMIRPLGYGPSVSLLLLYVIQRLHA